MIRTTKDMITLLQGETLNLTTDPRYTNIDASVRIVHADGYNCKFSARTKQNAAGEKRDRSSTGVFVENDVTKALPAFGRVFGPFDIVYCATGSDPIRCEICIGV